jgi:hypothetical protein
MGGRIGGMKSMERGKQNACTGARFARSLAAGLVGGIAGGIVGAIWGDRLGRSAYDSVSKE